VEYELLGSHYCFPWRNDFVFATEHTSWEGSLKSWHKKTKALTADEVTALTRGNFQVEHARNAWGAAAFLAGHHAGALPAILEDLRVVMAEKGVVTREDGTWERIPDWAPPAADQLAISQVQFLAALP